MFIIAFPASKVVGYVARCSLVKSVRILSTVPQLGNEDAAWRSARPYEEIPGPKPLPFIGNLYHLVSGMADLGDPEVISHHKKLSNKYGKMVRLTKIPGYKDIVLLFDPKLIEEWYRKEGPWPDRAPFQSLSYYRKIHRRDLFKGVSGILVERGKEWKKFRVKVNSPLMQPSAADDYLEHIVDVSGKFVERLKELRDSRNDLPSNFGSELNKWALENISMIAFDKRLGWLEKGAEPSSEPQKMIDAVEDIIASMEILEKGPAIWKVISTPAWRKFARAMDHITEVSSICVIEALNRIKEMETELTRQTSILEELLLRDSDPNTTCIMASDMLVVGIDTTSVTAGNMLYLLSRNQDKQDYLYKEIKNFLPEKNDKITLEMIKNMKYLKACLKESMRLLGIDAFNLRETTKSTVIGNHRIPKGVTIVLGHMLCGLSDQYYPQPTRYIPERWLKMCPGDEAHSIGSTEDYAAFRDIRGHPFAILPFGFGPRVCIGKRFADLELKVLVIQMIRKFKMEYEQPEIKYINKLFIKPVTPLKLKISERRL